MFRVTVSTHGAFIACISLATLFLSHSAPHFIRACPYLPVLLAIPPIAGATTFDISGQATAPVTHPIAHQVAMSQTVASHHLSIIGCIAPNPAPTTPERRASHPTHFAPAIYPPHIGAVSAICHPNLRASISFWVSGFVPPSVIPAIVISDPIFLNHSHALFAHALHLFAISSAHTRSSHHAITGHVTF
jgi:hypothetical protein